jgi:hypothetical protein
VSPHQRSTAEQLLQHPFFMPAAGEGGALQRGLSPTARGCTVNTTDAPYSTTSTSWGIPASREGALSTCTEGGAAPRKQSLHLLGAAPQPSSTHSAVHSPTLLSAGIHQGAGAGVVQRTFLGGFAGSPSGGQQLPPPPSLGAASSPSSQQWTSKETSWEWCVPRMWALASRCTKSPFTSPCLRVWWKLPRLLSAVQQQWLRAAQQQPLCATWSGVQVYWTTPLGAQTSLGRDRVQRPVCAAGDEAHMRRSGTAPAAHVGIHPTMVVVSRATLQLEAPATQ